MVPISSPLISPALCVWYLYFILLLLLQNCEAAELHAWSCWMEGKTKATGRRESHMLDLNSTVVSVMLEGC
jgi:hypothetical protein